MNEQNKDPQDVTKNHMNWRSLKIVGIGALAMIALMIIFNFIVDATTPYEMIEDVDGEMVKSSTGTSPWEPLLQLNMLGSMVFRVLAGLAVAYVGLRFFRNSIGKHSKDQKFDLGWNSMDDAEKTRWSIVALLVLAHALMVGSARGASDPLPISERGYQTILKYEVSSRSYYDRYLQRPTVPAWRTTSSGVTVGFGYDCGYNSRAQIARDWGGVLSSREVALLQSVSGLKGSRAYYANRGIKNSVRVTWEQADRVFKRSTLPRFKRTTAKAFKLEPKQLHPHCNGALVSLVFNRGGSMGRTSNPKAFDRRMEMRWIRHNLATQKEHYVPSNIRHMKRLWSKTKLRGLHLRRDAEASLFSVGLAA